MEEQRKYAILFAATILAARKLNEIGDRPCPARECAIADAIKNAKHILETIDERWPEGDEATLATLRKLAGSECVNLPCF